MAGDVEVVVFLEDPAQEAFISALIQKIAYELGASSPTLVVRNAGGGKGQVFSEYSKFVRDVVRGRESAALMVVAIDSDCRPRHEVLGQIRDIAERAGYQGQVVGAIPVPHVERWYLADSEALRVGTGGARIVELPYRCEKGYYKNALLEALRQLGITAPLVAAPYGEDIVGALDLAVARRNDPSLNGFYEDLRESLIHHVDR
jgi:hypothetical protein